tara:strand:+ start:2939 stop:3676 length:738 start_codon:yes stop_codon:yes gene_type:complete
MSGLTRGATGASSLLPVLLINLNASTGRRQKMSEQLARAGVHNWQRIPAVYGSELPPECHRKGRCADDIKLIKLRMGGRPAAVALSHMRAWRAVQAQPPGWDAAIVLEDDAILHSGFQRRATALWRSALPLKPDFLHLTYFRHLTPKPCVQPVEGYPRIVRLRCPHGMNTGQQAYVVSRRGAGRAQQALNPLEKRGKAQSFDLLLGEASMVLERFAVAKVLDEPAKHNWSVRSIRVHGLPGQRRR